MVTKWPRGTLTPSSFWVPEATTWVLTFESSCRSSHIGRERRWHLTNSLYHVPGKSLVFVLGFFFPLWLSSKKKRNVAFPCFCNIKYLLAFRTIIFSQREERVGSKLFFFIFGWQYLSRGFARIRSMCATADTVWWWRQGFMEPLSPRFEWRLHLNSCLSQGKWLDCSLPPFSEL